MIKSNRDQCISQRAAEILAAKKIKYGKNISKLEFANPFDIIEIVFLGGKEKNGENSRRESS